MKITTLEQALGKRVKCLDTVIRKLIRIDDLKGRLIYERDVFDERTAWGAKSLFEPLFLGGTIEEGE